MSFQSDWEDWFIRSVEDASPDGMAVWYLGCNGFIVKTSDDTTIFVDPYLNTGDPPRTVRMIPVPFDPDEVREADAVFATHEHSDHVDGPSQAPILAGTGADFYTTDAGQRQVRDQEWLRRWSVTDEQLHQVAEGDTVTVGDLSIHVEPANDPDAEHPVSFVFEHDAGTFFHAGDARPGEFEAIGEQYDIDLGVVAFGTEGNIYDDAYQARSRTRWYNDENQIIQAANALELDRLLPSHWDMWKGLTADPTVLYSHAAGFSYPKRLEIAEIGDRVDL